jgi:hypothetical protein
MDIDLKKLVSILAKFFKRRVYIKTLEINPFQEGECEIVFHVSGKE